jgi:hypothetical protein
MGLCCMDGRKQHDRHLSIQILEGWLGRRLENSWRSGRNGLEAVIRLENERKLWMNDGWTHDGQHC